jgi:blue copper oxidase
MQHRHRRQFLKSAAALGMAAALPGQAQSTAAPRLPIPPLMDARALGNALALDARAGVTEFFPGVASATLGYNGGYLGPTLAVHRGDDVEVTVSNLLAQRTTVHWHGLLVRGELDGGPHQSIAPGAAWRPVLPIRQPAATLFYHSHEHHLTAEQVYRGLAGVLIVRDDEAEARLGLPSRYGVDDLPLVLQDRQFVAGRLVQPRGMMMQMQGARGETILVNGMPHPFAPVPAGLVRLRLVNASNARAYRLSFDDARVFHVIASDGGLLDAPLARRALALAPAERAEILVDFSDGRAASLLTAPDDNLPMMGMGMMRSRAVGSQRVVAFEPQGPATTSVALPSRLVEPQRWDAGAAVRRRRFVLEMGMGMRGGRMGGMGMGGGMAGDMFSINGRAFDAARVDERVRLGDLEIWQVAAEMMAHPFHIHGVQFRVLSRGGRAPGPDDAGFKDTVWVDEPVELLVRFTQPAREAPFMYHCHILEHEDHGMMGQFSVA